jgi:hypothetical protein
MNGDFANIEDFTKIKGFPRNGLLYLTLEVQFRG